MTGVVQMNESATELSGLELVRKRWAELDRAEVARWLDDAPVGMDDIAEKIWVEYKKEHANE
jgi:hypothetical protein